MWETVREEDVQTPGDMFKSIEEEGFNVNYMRLPMCAALALSFFLFFTLFPNIMY